MIRHREVATLRVSKEEVLVFEGGAVDGFAAGSIGFRKVATLCYETLNDAVELGPFVPERLACLSFALFARAEASEVLSCLRNLIDEKLEGDLAWWLVADLYFEKYFRVFVLLDLLKQSLIRAQISMIAELLRGRLLLLTFFLH